MLADSDSIFVVTLAVLKELFLWSFLNLMLLRAKDYEFPKTLPDSAFIEDLLNFRWLVVTL